MNRAPSIVKVAYSQPSTGVTGSPLYGEISLSQQALKVNWIETVNLADTNKIKMSQIALCAISIDSDRVALGFKDGTIQIVTKDGQNISYLKEHKASICTLSVLKLKGKTYLASGSDIGCSKIILWDINTWQAVETF